MRRDLRLLTRTSTQPSNRAAGGPPVAGKRWFEITNLADSGVAEIKLRGYIGMPTTERDWYTGELINTGGAGTLQEFETELENLGTVKKLQLSIFSEGGDVFTGMAIHNLLARHPAKKTCVIDGVCASAATYPALACQEIQIPANSWMMIHGCNGGVYGGPDDMRRYAEMLDSMNATLVNLYAARTGKTAAEINTMLQAETWMDGNKAKENGFADTVLEPLQNLAARAGTLQATNRAMLNSAPAEVLALFDMSRISNAATAPLPMLKIHTPLMNAATDTPATPAAAAVATPVSAPTQAAAPAAAVVPATPAAPAAAAPAATAATPTNAAPAGMVMLTPEQLQMTITNAVQAGITAHVANQAALAAHGVSNAALGGAAPVAGAVATTDGAPATVVNTTGMTPMQVINLGRKNAAAALAATPAK